MLNERQSDPGPTRTGEGQQPPAIRVRNVTKRFRRRGQAEELIPVNDVSFDVRPNEVVVLLGPSGCGKTTLLRCVAGLERPDAGEIEINGKVVFSSKQGINLPPERRPLNMIFQSYALWPHMSVLQNIAYPLRCQRVRKQEAYARAHEVLATVGLDGLASQYPGQISGGQQQRVALARAVVGRDQVILFDEPLSNVDAKVRDRLRIELLEMQQKLGFSSLYVTHDQVEAMQLAHRVAVLDSGVVAQLDTPSNVYHRPSNAYVATFIGTANLWNCSVVSADGGQLVVRTPLGDIDAPVDPNLTGGSSYRAGEAVTVVTRPEMWSISDSTNTQNAHPATVEGVLFAGSYTEYLVRVGEAQVRIWNSGDARAKVGDHVTVAIPREHLFVVANPGT